MDLEVALLSKVVRGKTIEAAIEAKITPEFFDDTDNQAVWRFIQQYWTDHGAAPTRRVVERHFPNFEFASANEPLDYLVDELRKERRMALFQDTILDAVALTEGETGRDNIDAAIDAVSAGLVQLTAETRPTEDIDLRTNWRDRLADYKDRSTRKGMLGITTGFRTLDRITHGLQDRQLVTFIGAPKQGKSTMLLRMALAAHDAGHDVTFIGFEMTNTEQGERYDSMISGISYEKIRTGMFSKDERRTLLRAMKEREARPNSFMLVADYQSTTVLAGIRAKIAEHRPHILFVDGAYLMDDEEGAEKGSPRHLTNLTRGFKRLAQQANIPVVISTQVLTWKLSKRDGITADAIGYSSSFAQDSDLILGVDQMPDYPPTMKRLRVVLARASAKADALVNWNWETGTFSEFSNELEASGAGFQPNRIDSDYLDG